MTGYTPHEVVRVLKAAQENPHSAELQEVLRAFERRWLGLARRRWPWLAEHHRPAVNAALHRICTRIEDLDDPQLVDHWATLQFVRVIDGFRKAQRRDATRQADLSPPEGAEDGDPLDRIPSGRRGPEDEADFRARLAIVQSVVRLSREAYLRLVADLPVEEVSLLTGRSNEWIRTFTMRLRRALREYLDDSSSPRPPAEVFGKSGLPKDFVAKVLQLLRKPDSKP